MMALGASACPMLQAESTEIGTLQRSPRDSKLNGIDPRAWLADVLARLPGYPREPHPRTAAVALERGGADQRRRLSRPRRAARQPALQRGRHRMDTNQGADCRRSAAMAVSIRVYSAAARRPPSSEPANVQLRSPTAMPRSARSAALFDKQTPAVVQEAGESRPALQQVIDGVRRLRLRRQPRALGAQPGFEVFDQRAGSLIADGAALARRAAVDLAFDREQRIDPLYRRDGDRPLLQLGEFEEASAGVPSTRPR